jgi:pyruvate dehydrogenase E1 component alpha subunit
LRTSARHKPAIADAEQLVLLYRDMLLIRRFEEKCEEAYRKGKIGGYLHLYIGQEATGVGWISALRPDDLVIGAYRIHGLALQKGLTPNEVMAELFGRTNGASKGKGGSMHVYGPSHGFYGGWGIVGGPIPLGVGMAFAAKYHNTGQVVLCFLGDGAANAGVFSESLNIASLWNLPIIFIIENNRFAMGTRLEYHAADTDLHKRAEGYAMRHEQLDGMDVLQVRRDAERIIAWVRREQKPYLVEALNYRYAGHGAADHDQDLYRSKEEVQQWRERDPITTLGRALTEQEIADPEQLERWDIEAQKVVQQAYEYADSAPRPPAEEVYKDVYTDIHPEEGH